MHRTRGPRDGGGQVETVFRTPPASPWSDRLVSELPALDFNPTAQFPYRREYTAYTCVNMHRGSDLHTV